MDKAKKKLLSRRDYAKRRGVSHTAVNKAVKAGRIPTDEDGKIDPEAADRQWDANTDPSKVRGRHAEGEAPVSPDLPSMVRVRTMGLMLENKIKQTKLHTLEKKVYPVDKIRVELFQILRIARDNILNLPDKVSADLAGMTDFHEIHKYLSDQLRVVCNDIAESFKTIPSD